MISIVWFFWLIVLLVFYHKVFTVAYFNLSKGLLQEFIVAAILATVMASLTIYFWYVAVVIIILLGMSYRAKTGSNAAMVIAVAAALFIAFFGIKMKKEIKEKNEPEETQKQTETTYTGRTLSYEENDVENISSAEAGWETTSSYAEDMSDSSQESIAADYSGYWGANGGRYGVSIEKYGDNYGIFEDGSSGAMSHSTETMTGWIDDGKLFYSDGTLTRYQYGNDGSMASIVEYSNGSGCFIICPQQEAEYYANSNSQCDIDFFAREWDGIGDDARPEGNGNYLVWLKDSPQSYASSEYILWCSSQIELTEGDVALLSDEDKRLARNEIYARHGRKFDSADLQQHFDGCSWYQGTISASDFDDSVLSEIEKKNVKLLETGTSSGSSSVSASQDRYIWPESMDDPGSCMCDWSSTELITEAEMREMGYYGARIILNEIYARHGRRFNDDQLQQHFNEKTWYNGTISPENFSEDVLNSIEKQNIAFLQDFMSKHPQ
jgi:hypothetical protein